MIGPHGMEAFCSCFNKDTPWQLQELDIAGQGIEDEGALHFMEMLVRNKQARKNLIYLNLADNGLSFNSCKSMIRQLHFNGITKYLGLEKNNLSDDDRSRLDKLNNKFERVNMMLTPVIDMRWKGLAKTAIERTKAKIRLDNDMREHFSKRAVKVRGIHFWESQII